MRDSSFVNNTWQNFNRTAAAVNRDALYLREYKSQITKKSFWVFQDELLFSWSIDLLFMRNKKKSKHAVNISYITSLRLGFWSAISTKVPNCWKTAVSLEVFGCILLSFICIFMLSNRIAVDPAFYGSSTCRGNSSTSVNCDLQMSRLDFNFLIT